MEFSPLDVDSKSSSDETDRSDQITEEMGSAARSYGCVFCKRGFTTAQALGGHMNIHRKDRAKTRPSSLPPPMFDESYASQTGSPVGLGRFSCSASYPPYYYSYSSSGLEPHQVRYPVFFPSSTTWDNITRPSYNSHELSSIRSDPFSRDFFAEEYWRQNLNFEAGTSNISDNVLGGPKRHHAAEEDIDLELRLGYDP